VLFVKSAEGKHGALQDPEVRRRVERELKMTRAVPVQEELGRLWDAADIYVENEPLKNYIENVILPDRQKRAAQMQAAR
jgi:hypothetical protein